MTEPQLGDPDLVVSPDPAADPVSLDVSVVIPCLNEEPTIEACVLEALSAIRAAKVRGEVIVVDNGSTDRSAELAAAAGARVIRENRPGYGQAYLAGLGEARGSAIFMGDGDGTYDFGELPRFLALFDAGADLILGSRLRGEILPGAMPWHHRWIGNPALTGLLNLLYRSGLSDAHCGLRMVRRSALPGLGLTTPGMEFASEMVIRARRSGLRCAEVPIVYHPRSQGSTSKLKSVADGSRHVAFILALAPSALLLLPVLLLGAVGLALLAASDHSVGGALAGIALFAIGGIWWLGALWLRTYRWTLLGSLGRQPADRPPIRSRVALATALGGGVGALVLTWRAVGLERGGLLSSAWGRMALGSLVLALALMGTALAIVQTRFRQSSDQLVASENASANRFDPWSAPPLTWLKRHPVFISAFALATALRVLVTFAFRPALLFHGDSFGYLGNAQNLVPDIQRPIFYPLVLHLLLPFHNLMVVTGLQHLIGLAVGFMVYALLRRLGAGQVLATIGALPVLFDAYQMNAEQYILTEPLFELLVVGAIVLVAWPKRASLAACAGAGVLLAAATLTRTVGLVLIVPVLAYVLVRRVGPLRATALATLFLVPLLGYAAWFNTNHGAYTLTSFDGYWLYGRVGQFADCTGLQLPVYDRVLCESNPPARRLGPNYYVWSIKSPVHRLHLARGMSADAVLRDFARRIIIHQPLDYARTVGGELLHYFKPGRSVGQRDYPVSTWQFRPFRIRFDAAAQIYVLDGRFPQVDRPLASKLWTYQRYGYTTGPLLALALLLGLAGAAGLGAGDERPLRAEGLLLASSGFLLLLAVEMTSSFDYRYLLPSLPLIGAGGALGASMIWRRIRSRSSDVGITPAMIAPAETLPVDDVVSVPEPAPAQP